MSIEFSNTELTELTPKILVMGVGGAGGNAVNNMIEAELQGVDFVVANTDAQALANSKSSNRIQLGIESTRGLGAGAQPKVGETAAEEALAQIEETMEGVHMAFITAGMGGGTGTGAAPVIARKAKEKGILTVGVVTKPFQFEGTRRMKMADAGLKALSEHVDALIIIPNQNLFCLATEKTTFADAFQMADQVLHSGVRGITDLIVMPGLINLDFADVRTVMSAMGKAMMGTGEAEGESRAIEAAQAAIANPLLEDVSLNGARAVIINITGGMDMTLHEVDEAANLIRSQVDTDADIIVGSAFNQDMNGKIRVSVVATGIEGGETAMRPVPTRTPIFEPAAAPTPESEPEAELGYSEEHEDDVDNFEDHDAMSGSVDEDDVETDSVDDDDSIAEEDIIPFEPSSFTPVIARDGSEVESASEVEEPLDLHGSEVESASDWGDAPESVATTNNADDEQSDEGDGGVDEADIIAANREDAFVVEPHKEPTLSAMPIGAADEEAEDAYDVAEEEAADEPAEEAEEETSGGLGFFRKLTRSTREAEASRKSDGGGDASAGGEEISQEEDKDDQLEIPAFLRKQN